MDTKLADSQLEIAKLARSFFDSRSQVSAWRGLQTSTPGYSTKLWAEIAHLDWLRLGHDALIGGVGGGLLDLSMIYEAVGRNLVSIPHLESAVIGAGILKAAASTEARAILAGVLAGSTVVVPAITEDDAAFGPEGISLAGSIEPDGGLRLNGTKLLVAYANSADYYLVAARTAPADGDGLTVALVRRDTSGVRVADLPNLAGVPLSAVSFDDVRVDSDSVVGQPGRGWSLLEPVLDRATVLRSAQIGGASQRLLEMSVEYVNQRSQFGKPVGSFQAVQYLCSDIAINSHLCLLFARYAAGLIDSGMPASKAVSQAKLHANRTARIAPERAHGVFAGIGYMMEFDVQLYTRCFRYWELDLGDDHYHSRRLAGLLGQGGSS
jgi:alkylation response protein AidB-like acyl-CoA dehydrogenase